ncbi:MAG: glycosyltransferase [Armatimonadetes bacterium]|nr:glycosyltransferase [Armatimonadota bacterium]
MRILHIHHGIGIGGVETYLCRLAAGQTRAGHEVGVLASGGVYESRLAEAGARFFPVATKKENLARAVELARPFRPDLVHAHNYRAARFGRRLAARLGARYLMSVHGPRPWYKRALFRDWSPLVIAMSEADRDNVSAFPGVARRRVRLSFYGIDCDRFRPGLDTAPLRSELALPDDALPIVHVSRFAHDKARPADGLLDALERIVAGAPRAVLLLVGEGPELERLRQRAEAVNRRAGRPVARVVGPRQDVERFLNLATVAVATANTALEAIACGAPLIAAGRTGYLGRVAPEGLEAARAVCFADHGRLPRAVAAARFLEEIPPILADPDARHPACQALREAVARSYDVAAMVTSLDRIYAEVVKG